MGIEFRNISALVTGFADRYTNDNEGKSKFFNDYSTIFEKGAGDEFVVQESNGELKFDELFDLLQNADGDASKLFSGKNIEGSEGKLSKLEFEVLLSDMSLETTVKYAAEVISEQIEKINNILDGGDENSGLKALLNKFDELNNNVKKDYQIITGYNLSSDDNTASDYTIENSIEDYKEGLKSTLYDMTVNLLNENKYSDSEVIETISTVVNETKSQLTDPIDKNLLSNTKIGATTKKDKEIAELKSELNSTINLKYLTIDYYKKINGLSTQDAEKQFNKLIEKKQAKIYLLEVENFIDKSSEFKNDKVTAEEIKAEINSYFDNANYDKVNEYKITMYYEYIKGLGKVNISALTEDEKNKALSANLTANYDSSDIKNDIQKIKSNKTKKITIKDADTGITKVAYYNDLSDNNKKLVDDVEINCYRKIITECNLSDEQLTEFFTADEISKIYEQSRVKDQVEGWIENLEFARDYYTDEAGFRNTLQAHIDLLKRIHSGESLSAEDYES